MTPAKPALTALSAIATRPVVLPAQMAPVLAAPMVPVPAGWMAPAAAQKVPVTPQTPAMMASLAISAIVAPSAQRNQRLAALSLLFQFGSAFEQPGAVNADTFL